MHFLLTPPEVPVIVSANANRRRLKIRQAFLCKDALANTRCRRASVYGMVKAVSMC